MLVEPGRRVPADIGIQPKKGEKRVRNISQKDVKGQGPQKNKRLSENLKKILFHFIYICRIWTTWGLMDPQMLLN
jgi:hypothetical protein